MNIKRNITFSLEARKKDGVPMVKNVRSSLSYTSSLMYLPLGKEPIIEAVGARHRDLEDYVQYATAMQRYGLHHNPERLRLYIVRH